MILTVIYRDLWQPVWPNWFAGLVAAPIAYFWGKATQKRADKRNEDLKQHISTEHEKSRRHLENTLAEGMTSGLNRKK